ncbi:hypothetical protein Tco_0909708 [Tanacetum coccineum]|uniref:Uncharacterized protein n=1 Tax=Tanacetum coccineum TaxID=301880 RepID=A0ABQ5CSY2_9ASTR
MGLTVAGPTDGATDYANMDTNRLRWGSKSLGVNDGFAKKSLVDRENVGFDLTKYDLCTSFIEALTAKGMGLRVADSHTGNHREDGFTPLETIRRFLGLIGSRSLSSSNRRPSNQRGGCLNISDEIVKLSRHMEEDLIETRRLEERKKRRLRDLFHQS